MKQVEKFIPSAVQLIKDHLTADIGKLFVPDVYKGYVASMGASIILSGLIPTLAFYNNEGENSGSEQPRRPLLNILQALLLHRYDDLERRSLFDYALTLQAQNNRAELRQLRRDVINASIAVKLALRSFQMKDKK